MPVLGKLYVQRGNLANIYSRDTEALQESFLQSMFFIRISDVNIAPRHERMKLASLQGMLKTYSTARRNRT